VQASRATNSAPAPIRRRGHPKLKNAFIIGEHPLIWMFLQSRKTPDRQRLQTRRHPVRNRRISVARPAVSTHCFWLLSKPARSRTMTLSPEQKQAVAAWVAAGDNLAEIQKKLSEQFKLSMTYMDVRFLVDDLGLELKSRAPAADANADLSKARPAPPAPEKKEGLLGRLKKAVGAGDDEAAEPPEADAEDDEELPPEIADDLAAGGPGAATNVKVEIDRLVRPGSMVSGSITFSDGVSGKWAMDQYGRLMLDMSRKGYQPSAADVQAFQRELTRLLQRQGY
jgi:hypothetical protein